MRAGMIVVAFAAFGFGISVAQAQDPIPPEQNLGDCMRINTLSEVLRMVEDPNAYLFDPRL